jgi:hypothetical protein
MNNSHLVMALPTFSQDANPPTVAHLLGMYPTAAASHGVLMGSVSAVENSNVDVSNMLVNHDFQYQMWQKQQQQQMGLGIGGELAPPIQMSVDDAFGDMPEVEDLPLPSLQYSVPEDQVDDHIVVDDLVSNHEDFGEFDAVQNENLPENANPEFPDDEFGNFEGQTDSSLSYNADIGYKTAETQNNGGTTVVKIEETVSEDHFNDFDNAHENVDDKYSATYAEDDHDDFEGFEGGINELNFPNKGDEFNGLGNAIDQSVYTTNNTISDFELNNNHVPTLSITDAFDSLVAEHEGTTSEIGVTVFAEDNADTNTKVVYTEDESDDFGGFESTTNQTPSEVDDFNESNRFRSTNIQSESKISNHGPTLSISEAFEGLLAEQDEFGSFDSTNDQAFEANEQELNQKHTPDEDDDFNGFQSPDYTEAYNAKRDNAPDIHPQFTNESLSSMMIRQSNHNHELSLSDGFGSMAADQEMSSVPYDNSGADGVSVNALQCDTNELIPADDDNDDDFGEFETNDNQMLAAEQQILSSQTSMNAQTLSISDAFNSMVSDDDSFKPETTDAVECMPTSEENQSCEGTFEPNDYVGSDEKKISDDGDPGTENSNNDMPANVTIGHYGFNTNTTGEQLDLDLSLLDDVFGDIQDAPLPPLESFSPMVYQAEVVKLSEPAGESEFNESFGDFEGNAVIEEHCVEATEPENDTEDDFGDFRGTQDAPLPPLESFSSTVNQGIESEPAGEPECNESFGGFEGNMVIEEQGVEATAPENDTEDDFGDFGGTQDAPLPPLESFSPMVNQGIESEPAGESEFNEPFGGFEGNMVIEERDAEATAPENDTEDDFGDFGGIQDAPLPPLESFSSTVNQGIESEPAGESEFNEPFGDFEGNVVTEEHDAGETAPRNDTEDDFGDFGGFSEAQEPSQTEATIIRPEATDDFDDSFGDFAGTDIEPISIRSQCIPNESEDDNLQKSESSQQETNDDFTSFEAGFPDFGQSSSGNSNEHVQQLFGSYNQQDLAPSDETAPEANKTDIECSVQVEMETNLPEHAAAISTSNNHVKMDEGAETFEQGDFGDFSAFGSANDTSETTTGNDFTRQSTGCAGKGAPDSEVSPHATAQIENARPTAREDFTLGSSSALPDATGEWQADDDFGDFATFDGAENTASADVFERDVFGDFAEFDSAPPNDEEITSSIHSSNPHQDLRDKISALDYNHMHQNIIPTKDTVIKCFDRCTNRKVSMTLVGLLNRNCCIISTICNQRHSNCFDAQYCVKYWPTELFLSSGKMQLHASRVM